MIEKIPELRILNEQSSTPGSIILRSSSHPGKKDQIIDYVTKIDKTKEKINNYCLLKSPGMQGIARRGLAKAIFYVQGQNQQPIGIFDLLEEQTLHVRELNMYLAQQIKIYEGNVESIRLQLDKTKSLLDEVYIEPEKIVAKCEQARKDEEHAKEKVTKCIDSKESLKELENYSLLRRKRREIEQDADQRKYIQDHLMRLAGNNLCNEEIFETTLASAKKMAVLTELFYQYLEGNVPVWRQISELSSLVSSVKQGTEEMGTFILSMQKTYASSAQQINDIAKQYQFPPLENNNLEKMIRGRLDS